MFFQRNRYAVLKDLFTELNTTPQALALAWVARNSNTSTVILGASSADQLRENLKAVEVLSKLTPQIMEKIEAILANKPEPPVRKMFSFFTARSSTDLATIV